MKKLREISKKSVSFNCLKGKWFLPNTKARLKPPIDFLVRTEPLYNAKAIFGVVVIIECNQLQIGVFVLVRIESLSGFPRKKETREREKIDDDERCFISLYIQT